MDWDVAFHDEFESEFDRFPEAVQDSILVMASLLARTGPELKRPHADTLNGSKHANMKELRCRADDGVWRIAYAFDPKRKAILLTAGDKAGKSEKRFYKILIATADRRFDAHLMALKSGNDGKGGK